MSLECRQQEHRNRLGTGDHLERETPLHSGRISYCLTAGISTKKLMQFKKDT